MLLEQVYVILMYYYGHFTKSLACQSSFYMAVCRFLVFGCNLVVFPVQAVVSMYFTLTKYYHEINITLTNLVVFSVQPQ